MKTFKILVLAALVAFTFSLVAQWSGLDQVANSNVGRSMVAAPASLAAIFIYNMATSLPLPGGLKMSIHSKWDIMLACVAGVLVAVLTSVFTY